MHLSMIFFGNMLFCGVSFSINLSTWSIWQHVHLTKHAISRQLSVISVKYMFSLSTCTCLNTLICFSVYYLLLFSRKLGHDHVITLGQQSSDVKICYSRDHLLSLKNSILPISYSLCATISCLGVHASNQLCVKQKSRKCHPRPRSKIGQIYQIQVVPISSSRSSNLKASSTLIRAIN